MLNEHEFNKAIKELNVISQHQKDLASAIWLRCERAMQGKTNQEPRLLKKNVKSFTAKNSQFTQSELQQLQSLLKKQINTLVNTRAIFKYRASYAWDFCDKENSAKTKLSFETLNHWRTKLNKVTKEISKFENIQRKLKKATKTKDKYTT
jgi:hypothetical protein